MKCKVECLCGNIKNVDIDIWQYHHLICKTCKNKYPLLKNTDEDILINPSELHLCHVCDEVALPNGRSVKICEPCIDEGITQNDIPIRFKGKNNLQSKVFIPPGWEENQLAIDKIITASKNQGSKISEDAAKQQYYKIQSRNINNKCSECANGVKWLYYNPFPGYYSLRCTNSNNGCDYKEEWSW